ncbi:zinc-finger domain-containing protein [Oceanibium sediminis]|uniref:zinc-finger domain-containing protein n=1 Tax=Oceanibium sediminis TaxID=2026339 RepID=UPI000DD3E8F7|nr:zinc-finger domain-containing protein [Oceanibium sediminis]
MSTDVPEVEIVTQKRVACDGGTLGHPRVWLQIDPETGYVECGYCDKRYILKDGPADKG